MAIVQTVMGPSTSHLPPCLVDPMVFLSVTLRHFIPFANPCLVRAVSTVRTLAERVLPCDEHFVQTNGNEFLQWDGVAEDDDVDSRQGLVH